MNELQRWVNNTEQACRYIARTEPDLTRYTDVNLLGRCVTDTVNPSDV